MPSLRELFDVATECALLGGKSTLKYFGKPIDVETKSDDTPVTMADREAERVIREIIAKRFPGHAILGEEMGESTTAGAEYRWIIDPIDGTKTFIRGVPLYGAMVGVEHLGRVVAGACYLPALDEMCNAADGMGCFHNGNICRVNNVTNLADSTLLASDSIFNAKRSPAFDAISRATKLTRTWGDVYGYILVATGRAEIMMNSELAPWDCAPLLPMFREAGGRFSTWRGEETCHGGDGFATNGHVHDAVLAIIAREEPSTTDEHR